MSLTITKASDPIIVEQVVSCIMGPPGTGKTSMGFTAESPLLLDFDAGAYRSQFRKDTVQIRNWGEIEGIGAADLTNYSTVVVDTAGRALDSLTAMLISKNPKLKGYGGALSLQGYGALKTAFVGWLKLLQSFGKDVVLLAHLDEQKNGDELIERLDVQGGSKGEIYKCADAMGRIKIHSGQRTLNFNPSDTAFGKNPAQLPVIQVPDYHKEPLFLAGVIQSIKDKLNESSEAGLAELVRMREMRESFSEMTEAAQFTAKAIDMAKAPAKDKALLLEVAKDRGFVFDKRSKGFLPASEGATA